MYKLELMRRGGNLLLRVSSLLSKLALMLFLSRFLEVDDLGYYGLFAILIVYSVGLIGFEFHTYSNRNYLTTDLSLNYIVSNHLIFSICSTLVALPFLLLLFKFDFLPSKYMAFFLAIVLFEYLSLEITRLYNILGKQVFSSFLLFIRTVVWIVPLCIAMNFSIVDLSLWNVYLFWLLGVGLSFIVGIFALLYVNDYRWANSDVDFNWIATGLKKSWWMLLSAQSVLLLFVLDRYVIKFEMGIEFVSIYVFYFGLTNAILSLFESAVFVFFIPKVLSLFSLGKINTVRDEYKSMLFTVTLLSAVVIMLSILLIDVLLDYVGKPIFINNLSIFYVLLFSAIVRVFSLVPHYSLYSMKQDSFLVIINVASLGLFPFLCIFFLQYWDALYSVAYSLCAINVAHFVIKTILLTIFFTRNCDSESSVTK